MHDMPLAPPIVTLPLGLGAFVLALYALALACTGLVRALLRRGLPHLRGTRAARSLVARWNLVAARHPRLTRQLGARLTPRSAAGLPLTVIAAALVYASALLGELAEEVAEAEEVVQFDHAVMAALDPYRTDTLVTLFALLTRLGDTLTVLVAAALASLLLWRRGRRTAILPLWAASLGAQLTTWFGKQLIGRARPEFVTTVFEESASFPSGHATAAIATYGFIAYALAWRTAGWRGRFEVLFWTGILIALIGFSRVFLSVHYPSDVVAGFLVGSTWLLAALVWAHWRDERSRTLAGSVPR